MTVTAATFRADFPEFGNNSQYPPSVVTYYLTLGGLLLNVARWGRGSTTASSPPTTLYDMALGLFVAHHIVLEYQAQKAAAMGAPPGTNPGAVASKGVGPISISYDNGATALERAGHWNLTVYGKRFFQLADMAGAGPTQIVGGPGFNPASAFVPSAFGAWAGPPVWPGWFWNT